MKTFVISLIIWLLIVPCAVAIFLILTFLAAFVPNLYFVLTWIAVAFATLAAMWGLLSLILAGARLALADPGARTVRYSQQDIVSVRAKIKFSTLIVLPQNEEILDFATGDKEFWIVNGAHNLCYV